MAKTNVQHLRDIIKEFETHDSLKAEEAGEFLDSIEEEIDDLKQDVRDAESAEPDKAELEEIAEDYIADEFTKEFVGLDTIEYRLVNGNLKIQMQVEQFVKNLQKQNLVSA
jgi:hypothetical protein